MTRQYNPHINPLTGQMECLYAGCGREIPGDHYLCKKHYALLKDGRAEPCPGPGCARFKSTDYDSCVDCSKRLEPESDPLWEAGDEDCSEFFAYLLVSPDGDWYPGHTRNLRNRVWLHSVGRCRSTQEGEFRLVWFEVYPTRVAAASRELELKLDFPHFKRRKQANLQVGGTGRPEVPAYRGWLPTVKNPPTPATGGGAPGQWRPRRSATACHTKRPCVGSWGVVLSRVPGSGVRVRRLAKR